MLEVLREAEAVVARSQPRDYAPTRYFFWSRYRLLADATVAGFASVAPGADETFVLGGDPVPPANPREFGQAPWAASPWRDRIMLWQDSVRSAFDTARAHDLPMEPWVHPGQERLFDPDTGNGG